MMGDTHAAIGGAAMLGDYAISAMMPGYVVYPAGIILGGWVIANIAALGPDIDSKGSIVSQLFGYPSKAISYGIRMGFGGHRKITHSFLGLLIVAFLLYIAVIAGLAPWVAIAIGVGWTSHVASDSLTVQGCPWFWPLDMHHYGIPLVRTGHESETRIVVPLAGFATLVFAVMLLMGK
jgi:membrane-bound metal-dependent hydrolase YbcI (DUF457 family)